MRAGIRPLIALGVFAAAAPAAAQSPAVRPLGAVTAKATESFVAPNVTLRAVPGGLLVNDIAARRVVMLDQKLAFASVVADTTPATANAYSGRIGGLLPYKGDSSLFVDPQALSMLVIDPAGKVARVMSVPRSDDAMSLTGLGGGTPALDAAGRLVYRAAPNFRRMMGGMTMDRNAPPPMPQIPDSAALVRVDLATRAVDTVGWFKTPAVKMNVTRTDDGQIRMSSEVNPLPTVDDWAVLSDGTIALVRGRDYHVDFVDPDGARRSAAKIAFEWQRLTDEQKVALIDSVKAMRERQMAEMRTNAPMQAGSAPIVGGGGGQMVIEMRQGPGRDGGPPPSQATRMTAAQVNFVSPSELPDYRPAFFAGNARADLDGNLWIRTTSTKAGGGAIYDVVNRKGELVDRVQIPANRSIAAFGPNGAVYLTGREGTATVVERASVK